MEKYYEYKWFPLLTDYQNNLGAFEKFAQQLDQTTPELEKKEKEKLFDEWKKTAGEDGSLLRIITFDDYNFHNQMMPPKNFSSPENYYKSEVSKHQELFFIKKERIDILIKKLNEELLEEKSNLILLKQIHNEITLITYDGNEEDILWFQEEYEHPKHLKF